MTKLHAGYIVAFYGGATFATKSHCLYKVEAILAVFANITSDYEKAQG